MQHATASMIANPPNSKLVNLYDLLALTAVLKAPRGSYTSALTFVPLAWSHAMRTCYSSTSVLLSIFYALFAETAFLPTTLSLDNATRLSLPVVNVSGTASTAVVAPIPVSFRRIVLAFLERGRPIPEDEVKDTLVEADRAIADLVREHPTQRITNDRFEFRRPNGNMLISIKTNIGEQITWIELSRVIQGLFRYMTPQMESMETHYQELEFEIEASDQEKPNIGLGLVWYFNAPEGDVQKRATLPSPISLLSEGAIQSSNETTQRLPNATFISPGAQDVQENTVYPIPKTSLRLSFYYFGPPIPAQSVKATLQGALAKVRPFLNGPSEADPIENDAFRWILPLSREAGIPVAVTVYTYHGHVITWRQLFDVLFGLYAFTTTFGTDLQEPHYQILGFRILDDSLRRLGVGTISYFRYGTNQLSKRDETIGNVVLLRPQSVFNASLPIESVSGSIVYPVAGTDVTLTFTFLGDTQIPPVEVNSALIGVQQEIAHMVGQHPDARIPGAFKYTSHSHYVLINILAYAEKFMTWKELDDIVRGLLRFCQNDREHDRVLVFEIDIETTLRGRVGFGTMLYVQSDPIHVEKRELSTQSTIPRSSIRNTTSQPSLAASATPMPYPIPGTQIILTFDIFGEPIPSIYVNAALTSALRNVHPHAIHHPDSPIPNGRWSRGLAVTRIWIEIAAFDDSEISWQELEIVLTAVLRFMTELGEPHCRSLGFVINRRGEELAAGHGGVVYFPDDGSPVDIEQ